MLTCLLVNVIRNYKYVILILGFRSCEVAFKLSGAATINKELPLPLLHYQFKYKLKIATFKYIESRVRDMIDDSDMLTH